MFGKIVNEEMPSLIRSGELQTLCGTWLEQPIPPKGEVLNLTPA